MSHISVVVVVSFFLCWSPYHAQRLMFVLVTLTKGWDKHLIRAQHLLFVISGHFVVRGLHCTLIGPDPSRYCVLIG